MKISITIFVNGVAESWELLTPASDVLTQLKTLCRESGGVTPASSPRKNSRRGAAPKPVYVHQVVAGRTPYKVGHRFESTRAASAELGHSYDRVYQGLRDERNFRGSSFFDIDWLTLSYLELTSPDAKSLSTALSPAPVPRVAPQVDGGLQ